MAWTLTLRGKFEEARTLAEEGLERWRRRIGRAPDRDHPDTLGIQDTLAFALEGLGQLDEARQLREEVLLLSSDTNPHRQEFSRNLALYIALNEERSPDQRQRAIDLAG
jgi:hypothetical protein